MVLDVLNTVEMVTLLLVPVLFVLVVVFVLEAPVEIVMVLLVVGTLVDELVLVVLGTLVDEVFVVTVVFWLVELLVRRCIGACCAGRSCRGCVGAA